MSSRSSRSSRKRSISINDTSDDSKMDISIESGATDDEVVSETSGSKKQKLLSSSSKSSTTEKETIDGGVPLRSVSTTSAKKKEKKGENQSEKKAKTVKAKTEEKEKVMVEVLQGDEDEEEEKVLRAEVAVEEDEDEEGEGEGEKGGEKGGGRQKGRKSRKEYRPNNIVANPRQHPMAYMQELYYHPSSTSQDRDDEDYNDNDESMMTYHEDSFVDERDLANMRSVVDRTHSSSSKHGSRGNRAAFADSTVQLVPVEQMGQLDHPRQRRPSSQQQQQQQQRRRTRPSWTEFTLFAHFLAFSLHLIVISMFFALIKACVINPWSDTMMIIYESVQGTTHYSSITLYQLHVKLRLN